MLGLRSQSEERDQHTESGCVVKEGGIRLPTPCYGIVKYLYAGAVTCEGQENLFLASCEQPSQDDAAFPLIDIQLISHLPI